MPTDAGVSPAGFVQIEKTSRRSRRRKKKVQRENVRSVQRKFTRLMRIAKQRQKRDGAQKEAKRARPDYRSTIDLWQAAMIFPLDRGHGRRLTVAVASLSLHHHPEYHSGCRTPGVDGASALARTPKHSRLTRNHAKPNRWAYFVRAPPFSSLPPPPHSLTPSLPHSLPRWRFLLVDVQTVESTVRRSTVTGTGAIA